VCRFQAVEAALPIHRGFDEAGVKQHAQVFRHGRLRHTNLTLDFSNRLLGQAQQAQNGSPVRLSDDFKNRSITLYIR
jgi:hypothetical protein